MSISRLLKRFFGREESRALFLGLDASGRTSFLYKIVLGEVVTTIPTIGFNVETFSHNGLSITAWDVGGCDKIRPLWRHYFQNTDLVVFFVDSNDRDRLNEVEWSLGLLLTEDELRDIPILVLATKQDLPNVMGTDDITKALSLDKLLKGRDWTILPSSSLEVHSLTAALDWLVAAIRKSRAQGKPKKVVDVKGLAKEKSLLEQWLEVEDEPDDEFLEKLTNYTLDSWDHRTHLRLGWLYLKRHGRREGMKLIFTGIQNFIANSPRARKTTFHETMTYFWTHMIHYAMEATKNPSGDFKGFLLMNPQLSDGGLFLEYYNKETMLNNQEARKQVVLPDKKQLPSLISRVDKTAVTKLPDIETLQIAKDSDETFLVKFEERTLDRWNHECYIRVIYCYLAKKGRKKGVDCVFDAMKAFQKEGFHFTLTYFWIQLVWHAMASAGVATNTENEKAEMFPFSELLRKSCQLANDKLPLQYYSEKLLYQSGRAEKEMVLPDKKPLPSVVPSAKSK